MQNIWNTFLSLNCLTKQLCIFASLRTSTRSMIARHQCNVGSARSVFSRPRSMLFENCFPRMITHSKCGILTWKILECYLAKGSLEVHRCSRKFETHLSFVAFINVSAQQRNMTYRRLARLAFYYYGNATKERSARMNQRIFAQINTRCVSDKNTNRLSK